ncbi:MAG: DUF177 domain-containing protein [Anaerolineae bacterium]|nr:DUF177 domain-containing protein [Anaerolineae bacterium]
MRIDVSGLLFEGVGAQVDYGVDLGFCQLSDDTSVLSLRGTLHLWRTTEGIWVRGSLAAEVDLQCVRCLASVIHVIEMELDERFRFPPIPASEADQVYPIEADHHIDLAPALRELVIVSTPMHVLCREDCAGLCPMCGKDLNEGPCDCEVDDVDPRLAALKALLT